MSSNYIGRNNTIKIIDKINNLKCKFIDDDTEHIILGGASSMILGGNLLADILEKTNMMFNSSILALKNNEYASPLNLHTSIGISSHINKFIQQLENHLPNNFKKDWSVSIQLEGSSAVHAAVDILLSGQNKTKQFIGVGTNCYHGPKITSFGKADDRYLEFNQIFYPVPILKNKKSGETIKQFYNRIKSELSLFIEENKDNLGVLIIEPQWGSAGTGQFWPKDILTTFVKHARKENILVVCDEIMCGLGRHGKNKMFLTDALNLEVDAITFGKSIAGGIFPLSGAIINYSNNKLRNILPRQSHTYSHGANIIAIVAATQLLVNLHKCFYLIEERELIIKSSLANLKNNNIISAGQGLLWGFYINYSMLNINKYELDRLIKELNIIVYIVPDGILITPIYNCDKNLLNNAMNDLVKLLNNIN